MLRRQPVAHPHHGHIQFLSQQLAKAVALLPVSQHKAAAVQFKNHGPVFGPGRMDPHGDLPASTWYGKGQPCDGLPQYCFPLGTAEGGQKLYKTAQKRVLVSHLFHLYAFAPFSYFALWLLAFASSSCSMAASSDSFLSSIREITKAPMRQSTTNTP